MRLGERETAGLDFLRLAALCLLACKLFGEQLELGDATLSDRQVRIGGIELCFLHSTQVVKGFMLCV